jgi:hypothetical protein
MKSEPIAELLRQSDIGNGMGLSILCSCCHSYYAIGSLAHSLIHQGVRVDFKVNCMPVNTNSMDARKEELERILELRRKLSDITASLGILIQLGTGIAEVSAYLCFVLARLCSLIIQYHSI